MQKKKKNKNKRETTVNLILVAVSSGCYSAGVGRVEEDVEFNRFFGFIFSTMGGTQVAPFGFMWFTSVACQLDAAGLSDVVNSV